MNPRLIAIAGPQQGSTIEISQQEASIGREESNSLVLSDSSASRRHCVIQQKDDQFWISDLDSRNGTFVNGIPTKKRMLQHGDRLEIGDSLFLFLLHEADAAITPDGAQLDAGGPVARPTVRLRMEDSIYLHPEKMLKGTLLPARMAQGLDAILRISTNINSIRSAEVLQQKLLKSIFEVIPAERGAILLTDETGEEFSSVLGRGRHSEADQKFQVSTTIATQILREGVAILSNDVQESEGFSAAKSVRAFRITSVLAVPLLVMQKVLGVIYLDTQDATVRFDEEHLQLITAIAGIGSVAFENVRHIEQLKSENRRLQEDIDIEHSMIGESASMRAVYQLIARVAPSDSTVLICGESGTGKELAARAIHRNSVRSGKAFVVINCAALTETLLESELFGYEKGAFTGALSQRKGKLEAADGGTVFLDEVGEIPTALQSKLLRVLQDREFDRVGGTRPIRVDVRFIAATNRNLEEGIKSGAFRNDLYYRLNVVRITMPPLRERQEDIPLLATYFAAKHSKISKRRIMGISAEARARLTAYDWPGNVRELENAIERAVVLGAADEMLPEDLPEVILETEQPTGAGKAKYFDVLKKMKKDLIADALQQASGNQKEAAKILGIHPSNLNRLMRNLRMKE